MSNLLLSVMGARRLPRSQEAPQRGPGAPAAEASRLGGSEDRPGPRFRDQPRDRLPVPVYQALTATLVFCQGSKAVPSGWESMGE